MGSSVSQTKATSAKTNSTQQKPENTDSLNCVIENDVVTDSSSTDLDDNKDKMEGINSNAAKTDNNNTGDGLNEETNDNQDENDDDDPENDNEDEKEDEKVKKKKEPPFTPEELENYKQGKFEELERTREEVFALENIRTEDGEFDKVFRNGTVRISNAYVALTRAVRSEIRKFRQEYARKVIDSGFVDLYFDVIKSTYNQGWYDMEGKKIENVYKPFSRSLITLLNFTDASDDLTITLADKPGFLEFTRQVLVDYQGRHLENVEPPLKPTEGTTLNCVIGILHNISMRESNISRMRSVGFTTILPPYLNSKKELNALNVLATLAGIIKEEECEIILANQKTVKFLLNVLKKGLTRKTRRHRGWSTMESGLAIRTLARNDANKKLLVDLDALELLVELGKTGDIDEQCESAGAIWALCFDEDIKTRVTSNADLGVVEMLIELKKTDCDRLKYASNGALWTIRDALKKSPVDKYKEIGETLAAQNEKRQRIEQSTSKLQGHIMISYQWADQELLKVIRDRIKECGYKVWMDIDQMGGSTLQAMADAVEGADIFLMSYSNKYKNSPACRAEAEYAFQLRKKIIPLKMEQGYVADGWLGFILGSKLFFDFSGKYPFEDKMQGLLKELKVATTRSDNVDTGVTIQPQKTAVTHSAGGHVTSHAVTHSTPVAMVQSNLTTISAIRKWNSDDTKKWIEANGLQKCMLSKMSGPEIAFLAKMQTEAPEFFYKYLQDTLKARDVTTMSKIVWALNDITH